MNFTLFGIGLGIWFILALSLVCLIPCIIAVFTPWRKRIILALFVLYFLILGVLIACPRGDVPYPQYNIDSSTFVTTMRYLLLSTSLIGAILAGFFYLTGFLTAKQIPNTLGDNLTAIE